MKNIISILLVLIIVALSASAQEKVLEVLSVKGTVKWQNKGRGVLLDLQAYQRLMSKDKIILDTTGRVRFINNKTKNVAELRKPGKYRVGVLFEDATWTNDLKKFIALIIEEMKSNHWDTSYKASAIRSKLDDPLFSLYPQDHTIILQDEIHFQWDSKNIPIQKFFIAKDNQYLIELSIPYNSLTLSSRSEILSQPGKYIWKGYNTDADINPVCFYILSDTDREDLKKAIEKKKSEKTGNDLFDLLELAKFYKQHNLYIEADSTYELLLKNIKYE